MTDNQKQKRDSVSVAGVFSGISAYLIWGLSPIYWKELQQVHPFEIIIHRIFWSFCFLMILMIVLKQLSSFFAILKKPKILLTLALTSILVSVNWLVYIWSVHNGYILQASLGYYINPLVNVLLGMVFLREKLRRLQFFAVLLAFSGVLYLTVFYKTFPWVSLTLAFSFGFYALIRKTAAASSLAGLTIETMLLSVPASIYLIFLHQTGTGSLGKFGLTTDALLLGTGLVTAIPLLLFNIAGKRLMLATLGFLQYLAPTCMLLIGVFLWGNNLVPAQIISFIFIWIALAIYSFDSLIHFRS